MRAKFKVKQLELKYVAGLLSLDSRSPLVRERSNSIEAELSHSKWRSFVLGSWNMQ